jgi:hypothetical protein
VNEPVWPHVGEQQLGRGGLDLQACVLLILEVHLHGPEEISGGHGVELWMLLGHGARCLSRQVDQCDEIVVTCNERQFRSCVLVSTIAFLTVTSRPTRCVARFRFLLLRHGRG